jgi:hypothetical protein
MSPYSEAIKLLMNNDPERAIMVIRSVQRDLEQQRDEQLFLQEQAKLSEFNKTTDFIPAHGWEAA